MRKKIKNKDLANRLGVSGTLVSLVLNNKADQHGIKKETQERVLALARQMGYFDVLREKDEISPVEEKPGVIGMIVPALNDSFIYEITPFLQKAFSSIGVGFSIITKDPDDQRYNRLVGAFKKFYTGLILVGEAADDYTIRTLRTASYPFVLLEKSFKMLRLNTVCTDTLVGARLVADHIAKLGYKNVVLVSDTKSIHQDKPIIEEIKTALGQKPDISKPLITELNSYADINELDLGQFEKLLRPPYRADILVILHSRLVYLVMALLRNKKVRVPQDIAVISMEDGIGFDLMFTPVTSLKKSLASLALKVANMIWSEVKNSGKGKYKRQVNISPELVIRNSCGTI